MSSPIISSAATSSQGSSPESLSQVSTQEGIQLTPQEIELTEEESQRLIIDPEKSLNDLNEEIITISDMKDRIEKNKIDPKTALSQAIKIMKKIIFVINHLSHHQIFPHDPNREKTMTSRINLLITIIDDLKPSEPLYREQFDLALALAKSYLTHEKMEGVHFHRSLLVAMAFYGSAIQLTRRFQFSQKECDELHTLASTLIISFIEAEIVQQNTFFTHSWKAASAIAAGVSGVVPNTQKLCCILEDVKKLQTYRCQSSHDILFKNLFDQISRAFNIELTQEQATALAPIFRKITKLRDRPNPIPKQRVTEKYHQKITKLREAFSPYKPSQRTELMEKRDFSELTEKFISFFDQTLLTDSFAILGSPPCHYEIIAMGSIAREEPSPFSDIELFILIEDRQERNRESFDYFNRLMRLIELKILSFGETGKEFHQVVFATLGKDSPIGFHLDKPLFPESLNVVGSPLGVEELDYSFESSTLICRPQFIEKFLSVVSLDEYAFGNMLAYTLHRGKSIKAGEKPFLSDEKTLFEQYRSILYENLHRPLPQHKHTIWQQTVGHERALASLRRRNREYKKNCQLPENGCLINLKKSFIQPLFLFLADLSLYYYDRPDALNQMNTFDIIDHFDHLFDKESQKLLKWAVSTLYTIRVDLQSNQILPSDQVYIPHLAGTVIFSDANAKPIPENRRDELSLEQASHLEKIHWLILKPLYVKLDEMLVQKQTIHEQTLIDKLILFLKKQFGLSTDSQESVFGKQHQTISFIDLAIKKLTEELELIFLADESLTWDMSLSPEDKEKTQNYLRIAPKQLIQQISLVSSGLAIIDASEQRHQDIYCLIALSEQVTKQRTAYWEALDWKEDKIQTQLKPLQRRQHAFISALREAYIKELSRHHQGRQIAKVLSDIPDLQGMRISTLWAERRLSEQLALLTRDGVRKGNITCQVRRAGNEEAFFLNADALTMIDSEGQLIHQYPHTHRGVFGYPKESPQLFFKAYPYQPMAEYADFSLKRRLGITSSPTTELIRFDLQVNGRPLSYPVLISEAVSGIPLDQAIRENSFQLDRLNPAQLTLMALCELLLSPGDGRAENKILTNDGSILASIDNDVICVEPRVPSLFSRALWGRRFYFCSILFSLGNVLLDQDVLKRFAALNPSEILSGWIEDLRKKEQHYLSLFPNVEERIALYDSIESPNFSFTPTWVIQEKTLLRIDTQFRYLQQRIRKNSLKTILNLLGCYVSLDRTDHREMIEGQRLELAYASVYSLKTANPIIRLEQALNFDSKTMTNLESQKASCQIKPDAKQIENGQFSLRRAEEIYHRHQLVDQFALARMEKGEISINFSPWKGNRSRQRQLLNYLFSRIQEEKCLPTSLTLIQCEVLTEALLLPLLHNDLKELNLAKCPLQLSSNLLLTQAPHLERLVLSNCSRLTTFEGEFSQIQELRLDQCQNLSTIRIQAQTIHYFRADKTPNLKTLEIGNTLIIRMIIDDHYLLAKTRKDLQLERLFSNDPSLTTLDLTNKNIDRNDFIALSKAFQSNSSLTMLYLANNHIGDAGVTSLAEALQHNSSLTTLHLPTNRIGYTGTAFLAKALQDNGSLTTLNLSWNHIGAAGAASLAEALQHNSSLTRLNLKGNSINAAGTASLTKVLEHNSSIITLDLADNKTGAAGAISLAKALQHNNSLTMLDLRGNNIDDTGAASLIKALQHNNSLTTLYLGGNKIGSASAASLALGLQHNSSLTTLDLASNKISWAGAASLAKGLKHNNSLTTLDLTSNNIEWTGTASLAKALQHNNSLTTLYLTSNNNNIGAGFEKEITVALERNKRLQVKKSLKACSLPDTILEMNTSGIGIEIEKKRFPSLSNDHSPLILIQEKKSLSILSPFLPYNASLKVGTGLENSHNNCFFNAMMQLIMNSSLKDFFLNRSHLIAASETTTQDQIDRAFAFFSRVGETYVKATQTATNIIRYDSSEMRSILGLSPADQEDVFQAFNALCHFYDLNTLSIPFSFKTKVDLTTKTRLEAIPDDPIEIGDDGLSSSPRMEQSLTHPLALERVPPTIQKLVEETFSREEICDQLLTFIHRDIPYSVTQFTRQLHFDPQDLKNELLFHVLRFNKRSEKIMTLLPEDLFEVHFGSDANTVTYSLIGFIVHTGAKLESGHYIAYIKSARGWTRWSDATGKFFSDATSRQASSSSTASSSSSRPSLPNRAAPHYEIIAAARKAYILHYHKKLPSENDDT